MTVDPGVTVGAAHDLAHHAEEHLLAFVPPPHGGDHPRQPNRRTRAMTCTRAPACPPITAALLGRSAALAGGCPFAGLTIRGSAGRSGRSVVQRFRTVTWMFRWQGRPSWP